MEKINSFEELLIRASIHILMTDKKTMKPVGFGSGCLLKHANRYFFISVAHVTNKDLFTCLETNMPSEGFTTPIHRIDGLTYLSMLTISPDADIKELEKLLQEPFEPLDITFAEIKTEITLLQEEIDFGKFKVEVGEKVILDSSRIAQPSKDLIYGFYGKIRQDYTDDLIYLKMTPTIKAPLKFHRQAGDFYIFLAPKIINDTEDYEGCSGAPIIDSDGNLVALACKIRPKSQLIFGFSIHKCIELIDTSIQSGIIDLVVDPI